MLEVSIAKKATLVRDLPASLPPIVGDATQIRQVVMNLVLNASEAIGGAGGAVRVTTGSGTFGAEAFARSAAGGDPKPGAYVWIEVRDDGTGMDAATIAQMFDPFFTTKFVGRGLGMAAVLGIVRAHAGAIEVESTPGKGTRIVVFFPASAAAPVHRPSRRAPELAGHGVVLVVDDETNVRKVTQLLLRELGFEVLVAGDGLEAIEIFRTEASRIGAVLLDRTMPRMDGAETLGELRRIDPSIPIVMTSGYGAASDDESPSGAVPNATLAKPYSAERLIAVLREVMRR
jgi:CheY-like chemotaxis protein